MTQADHDGRNVTAACLTPPGAGGIAVIQVVGCDAPALLQPFLRAARPVDLEHMPAETLRLCRLIDGDQIIDDVLIACHRDPAGCYVVDLNLHGGPWIVQRTLLMLKRAGARIVEPLPHARLGTGPHTPRVRETTQALLQATTRPLAEWIARTAAVLPDEARAMADAIRRGRLETARQRLADRVRQGRALTRVLAGLRIVVTGSPNSGKSTLVNRLAGTDATLVSPHPGTTRDWTEHPAALDGLPVTLVDTAGLRNSDDPIEQEAIRRGRAQLQPADAVIHLIDGSTPLSPEDRLLLERPVKHPPAGPPLVVVWNKADLPRDPSHEPFIPAAGPVPTCISARTGTGAELLRRRLVEALGLAGWRHWTGAPFTPRQIDAYTETLSALEIRPPDLRKAIDTLETLAGR